MTSHLLFIITSLLMSGELSYGAHPDYIRLDLTPLRGGDVPSNTKAYPRRIPVEPATEKEAIFCTDSAYPNDIFCDIRSIYNIFWKNYTTNIYEVVVGYAQPQIGDVACNVRFLKEQSEEYPILRLPYSGFSCVPSFNDTQVPVFQLGEANRLTIKLNATGNCNVDFNNVGRVSKSVPKGRRVTVIKFELGRYGCVLGLANGRPTPKCEYDGRRCRPVNQ